VLMKVQGEKNRVDVFECIRILHVYKYIVIRFFHQDQQ
jgi:hypothetical protein